MPTSAAHLSQFRSTPNENQAELELRSHLVFSPNAPSLSLNSQAKQLQRELASLQEKQRWLQTRLGAMLRQQMQETFGYGAKTPAFRAVPDSMEMIIYGLREDLSRVQTDIASLQQQLTSSTS